MDLGERLDQLFQRLYRHYGPQHWWPGETPFEVMVGAVLTQNTNWGNVSRAIDNLKQAKALSLPALLALPMEELARLIRPAGYYNLKARRLRNLLEMLATEMDGRLERLWELPLDEARQRLLAVKGVGPETADSILLYAGQKPVFVVDAYTFRILGRHDLADEGMDYHDLQQRFMKHLPPETRLYNEYHALLVRLGKERCKKKRPLCEGCPLEGF